jgi:hypothetical protein
LGRVNIGPSWEGQKILRGGGVWLSLSYVNIDTPVKSAVSPESMLVKTGDLLFSSLTLMFSCASATKSGAFLTWRVSV